MRLLGTLRVCFAAGTMSLAACGAVEQGAVADAGAPPPGAMSDAGSACAALAQCCSGFTGAAASLCNAVVQAGNAEDCAAQLAQLLAAGECTGTSPAGGADAAAGPDGFVSTGPDGSVSAGPDASATTTDATTTTEAAGHDGALPVPPAGVAGFAFVINGVVQHPLSCVSENWQFPPFPPGSNAVCNPNPGQAGCPGVTSVVIVNTGQVAVAYYATNLWGGGYVPGVLTGATPETAGVMNPGDSVDITAEFSGGITALVGSAEPFSAPDAGRFAFDEGTIPWPAGVAGSGGAATMYVAEIEVESACTKSSQQW